MEVRQTCLPAPMPAASNPSRWAEWLKAGQTGGAITPEVSMNGQGCPPAFATHICDVEVDKATCDVKILRYTAIHDCGRAIRLENPGFLDYRVPVAPDVPMIDAQELSCAAE